MNNNKYVPGQCNIGRYESEKRMRVGIFSLILLSGFSFLFYVFRVSDLLVLVVLMGLGFSTALGFLQYKNHFCVYFGILAVFNFETITTLTHVKDLTDVQKDKRRALKLILYAFAFGLVYSVLYILLT
jgi:pilus assembly protein TadC